MYETIRVEREEHLTWLVLNRPEALNAMDDRLIAEVSDFFRGLSEDLRTRVVILRGEGRAFCAGLDLKAQGGGGDGVGGSVAGGLRVQRRVSEIVMLMRRAPQPIIAAVHGAACGGGFAMALASDVRIAGESARMNAAFIRIGLSACDVGVSYFLPRIVGASVASELLLTGDFIEAKRAEATGLVSRVVPDVALVDAARELAKRMLRNAPLGLRLTKECLKHSIDAGSLEQAVAMEDRNQILAAQSADFREGIVAFLQKREPNFGDT
ncbi:MAG: enoyl-CoA hydratase-related protein [Deltaproteobacteria bacterium]